MKKMTCECCGAPLKRQTYDVNNIYICEYCGTHYEVKNEYSEPIKIETFQNPVITLKGKYLVDEAMIGYMGETPVIEHATKVLSHDLADAIAEHMRMDMEYDPISRRYVFTSQIRIVKNDYRF